MAFSSRLCYLQSVKTKLRINLPHGKVIGVGRSEETQIADLFLSKTQIECTADVDKCNVILKPVGKCFSGCNGYALIKGKTYTLKHGDCVELRLGFHEFDIVFDPPPDECEDDAPIAKKPKLEYPVFNLKGSVKNVNKCFVDSGTWEDIDNKELLIFTSDNCIPQSKIAAFDVDGTIIKTKSGARFPKDPDDWILNFKEILQNLKDLHDQDYKIVFFTNQSGIGKDSGKIKGFKSKIERIISKISAPIQVFIATGKNVYRKPAPGMWDVLTKEKNGDVLIDIASSFYVGDAAGREKNWLPKRNKDHSIADRLFALNIGLKFYTPEEYFLKSKCVSHIMPEFDPKSLTIPQCPDISSTEQEVILMVGSQGSGKSFFCKKYLIPKGYVYVNRDILESWQKCVKVLEENLHKNKSVVVDNTNPDKVSRKRYIDVAKKYGVLCRCFVMSTTHKHSKHNNKFRELVDKTHKPVSEILINSYKKNYQEPELSEGYSSIIKIPFIPSFDKKEHEDLYKMFLLES